MKIPNKRRTAGIKARAQTMWEGLKQYYTSVVNEKPIGGDKNNVGKFLTPEQWSEDDGCWIINLASRSQQAGRVAVTLEMKIYPDHRQMAI